MLLLLLLLSVLVIVDVRSFCTPSVAVSIVGFGFLSLRSSSLESSAVLIEILFQFNAADAAAFAEFVHDVAIVVAVVVALRKCTTLVILFRTVKSVEF